MKYSLSYRLAKTLKANGFNFREKEQPEVITMQKEIDSLKNRNINFEIKIYPDSSWTAKATNIDGLLTGGRNQNSINSMIRDAIFTYYQIPPQHADNKLLRELGEPVTVEQQVQVTT